MSTTIHTFEFIGSELEVVESTHKGYEKMHGKVIDETKNMFLILDRGEEKMIPKKSNRFKLTINGRSDVLDGKMLQYRPEDRIKKLG